MSANPPQGEAPWVSGRTASERTEGEERENLESERINLALTPDHNLTRCFSTITYRYIKPKPPLQPILDSPRPLPPPSRLHQLASPNPFQQRYAALCWTGEISGGAKSCYGHVRKLVCCLLECLLIRRSASSSERDRFARLIIRADLPRLTATSADVSAPISRTSRSICPAFVADLCLCSANSPDFQRTLHSASL